MKQKITLAIDEQLLNKAQALAAQRGTSVSGLLADELQRIVAEDSLYEQAKERAQALLRSPFRLGSERGSRPGVPS